jgi:Transposase
VPQRPALFIGASRGEDIRHHLCMANSKMLRKLVTMERPAPIRSSWITLRVGSTAQRRATCEGAGHEQRTIYWSRCPCGTIAVAVAEPNGEVRSLGVILNRPASIRKLVKKLGPAEGLRVCYEAGPTGYVLYWELTGLGVRCEVVAPTLVPVKPGDRVKTDRRDALKLARSYRAGDLTAVWVPDAAHEALRDLVRAREAAKKDQLRARHRLQRRMKQSRLRDSWSTSGPSHQHLLP